MSGLQAVPLFHILHQPGLGSPPRVDGLLRVRHQNRRPLRVSPGKQFAHQRFQNIPLRKGGILEFVQEDVLDPGVQAEVEGIGGAQDAGLPEKVSDVAEAEPTLGLLNPLEGLLVPGGQDVDLLEGRLVLEMREGLGPGIGMS